MGKTMKRNIKATAVVVTATSPGLRKNWRVSAAIFVKYRSRCGILIQFPGRTIVSVETQLLPAALKDVDDGCAIAQKRASSCDPVA